MSTSPAEIALLVLSFIIVIVVLIQPSKNEGASAAIMGGNKMAIFTRTKERGSERIMTIITAVLVVAYFVTAILALYL